MSIPLRQHVPQIIDRRTKRTIPPSFVMEDNADEPVPEYSKSDHERLCDGIAYGFIFLAGLYVVGHFLYWGIHHSFSIVG